ncbi:hypothetical protein GWK47_047698 [Chionoecetes opilio]|uniref:Uncharacterized protein n=1 Tax=Chionoecetes opilio TaxID=41210 RepID=A0A8J4YCL8_CHIOP|nr:hypothetical protein GWK47_047698 [Chionoecetes opilio]
MTVPFQVFTRHVCLAAALCLVIIQVCRFFYIGVANRQPWRDVTRPNDMLCRPVFTITDASQRYAPNVSLFIQNHYGSAPPGKQRLTIDWRSRQYRASLGDMNATRAVQQLLLKRDSASWFTTTDYSPLAALLPTVLAFQEKADGAAPALTATSRITAADGTLPFVPCEIATYADAASVTACFRSRLAQQDSLWLLFMGDSKIRNIFYEFLARTDDELHYLIDLKVSILSVSFS